MSNRVLKKYENNPIMSPAKMPIDVLNTFNPGAIKHNGEYIMIMDVTTLDKDASLNFGVANIFLLQKRVPKIWYFNELKMIPCNREVAKMQSFFNFAVISNLHQT